MGFWIGPRRLGPCSSPLERKPLWSRPPLAASATGALDALFPLTWAPVPSTDLQSSHYTSEFPVFELLRIRKTTDIKPLGSRYMSASSVPDLFVMNILVLTLVHGLQLCLHWSSQTPTGWILIHDQHPVGPTGLTVSLVCSLPCRAGSLLLPFSPHPSSLTLS